MPTDKSGRFHLNTQRAMASDRMAAPAKKAAAVSSKVDSPAGDREAGGESSTTLHDHGDGTFHTESHDGERTEHPSIGHALVHLAAKHAEGGKHMHIHGHESGGGHTSHHAHEDGHVNGPHETESTDDLKEHVGESMGGEDASAAPDDAGGYDASESDRSLSGLTA